MLRPLLALFVMACLAGCPQERPEAARQIPRDRIPPAVSLEPPVANPCGQACPPAVGAGHVDEGKVDCGATPAPRPQQQAGSDSVGHP